MDLGIWDTCTIEWKMASLVKVSHGEKDFRKAQTLLQAPPTGQVWKSYYF
jgi:hypothetical protein